MPRIAAAVAVAPAAVPAAVPAADKPASGAIARRNCTAEPGDVAAGRKPVAGHKPAAGPEPAARRGLVADAAGTLRTAEPGDVVAERRLIVARRMLAAGRPHIAVPDVALAGHRLPDRHRLAAVVAGKPRTQVPGDARAVAVVAGAADEAWVDTGSGVPPRSRAAEVVALELVWDILRRISGLALWRRKGRQI